MICIGLITGPDADEGIYYLQELHAEARRRRGQGASARVVSSHLDADLLRPADDPAGQNAAIPAVIESARALRAAGARQLLFGSSVLHPLSAVVATQLKLPVSEIEHCTAAAVVRMKWRSAGVLATASAREERAWADCFAAAGIVARFPAEHDRAWIRTCLSGSDEPVNARARWVRIAADLRLAKADAVILCRPAANRYLRADESPLPVVCAARQQVQAAMEAALV